MRSTEEYIDMIANRIRAEHKKHTRLDWAYIAAVKIVRTLQKDTATALKEIVGEDKTTQKDCDHVHGYNAAKAEIRERINTLINMSN